MNVLPSLAPVPPSSLLLNVRITSETGNATTRTICLHLQLYLTSLSVSLSLSFIFSLSLSLALPIYIYIFILSHFLTPFHISQVTVVTKTPFFFAQRTLNRAITYLRVCTNVTVRSNRESSSNAMVPKPVFRCSFSHLT